MRQHTIILEEASLELIPRKYWNHESCKQVEYRFGIPAEYQILDDNYHHAIVTKLPDHEKRGRPDIVHLALLDITSTPAFIEGKVKVYVHTRFNQTIRISSGVRLPRTLPRFCGVFSKVISGKQQVKEMELLRLKDDQSFTELAFEIGASYIICFTSAGKQRDMLETVSSVADGAAWVVGGFPRGHFVDEVKSVATELISISKYSLPAHVVTARLCFAIERSFGL